MRARYDLHLHSCLSPCGDDEMTPYNLVNMAKLLGYDIIALTDHNTCGNCETAMKIGERIGITVVPGMELCTLEEIHCICLLPDIKKAREFESFVRITLPPIKNEEKIFGRQILTDVQDNITGTEETLLITASSISIDDLPDIVRSYGGVCYPAHIDRDSYSIISSLGSFVPELRVNCFEMTPEGNEEEYRERYPTLKNKIMIKSSDSHCLERMREAEFYFDLEEISPIGLISYLKG